MLTLIDPQAAVTNPDPPTALSMVIQTMKMPVTLSRSRYGEDCLEETLGPGKIEARYFSARTDRLHAFEHVHFARVTVA